MSLSVGKIKHMKALSNEAGIIAAAAMDQRGSLQKSIASAKGVDSKQVTDEMMSEFKTAVTKVSEYLEARLAGKALSAE